MAGIRTVDFSSCNITVFKYSSFLNVTYFSLSICFTLVVYLTPVHMILFETNNSNVNLWKTGCYYIVLFSSDSIGSVIYEN